jgi:hypothetical protein
LATPRTAGSLVRRTVTGPRPSGSSMADSCSRLFHASARR